MASIGVIDRMSELIEIAEGRRRVLQAARPLDSERVELSDALGRVLCEPVRSATDVPPFTSSAMDGFALVAGPPRELSIVGEARAGRPAKVRSTSRNAIRISTGAPMPGGSDAVAPLEVVEETGGSVRVPVTAPGANVRLAGEDIRSGEAVLGPGAELGPAELGVLASVGRAQVRCARRARFVVLATGDELVEPSDPLREGQIWSSNAVAVAAQARRAGAALEARETVVDERNATVAAIERGMTRADVICVSGGVSVGAHDHVRPALAQLGVEQRFWGVRLKPGKPAWFGTSDRSDRRVLVFGLPGNPVSAMVCFQLFVRPALRALAGADPAATRATAVLDAGVARNPRRVQAIRCRLRHADDGWHVEPTKEQGSHVLTSMLGADALALIPEGEGEAAPGERVEIELLDGEGRTRG